MDQELKDLIKEAKGSNNADTKYQAGLSFEKEEKYRDAFRWFLEAANDGHIESQIKIGDYYSNGTFIKQDYSKSILWYTRASTYGNSTALIRLAKLYKEGLGTEKDVKLAFELLYKASSTSEDPEAFYELALMAKHGIGTQVDEQSAFVWFKKASDAGYTKATVNAGFCYANGVGVEKNPTLAFECYSKAAEEKNLTAMFNLAICYKEGFGTEKDLNKALTLFEETSNMDHPLSFVYMAKCHEEMGDNEKIILDCYENGYAQGSYKACYYLSEYYASKNDNLSRMEWLLKGQNDVDCLRELGILSYRGEIAQLDYKRAYECFYKANEQGDSTSAYYLALMHFEGQGVDKSEETAMAYLEKASEGKNVEAMFLLSSKLEESDPNKSLELLETCASLECAKAIYKLGKWYSIGYITTRDEKKAFTYYTKAANLGDYNAMCNLGIAYVQGKGIKPCFDLAMYWFRRASEGGVVNAKFNLGYCYQNAIGGNKDLTSAINCYTSAARDGHAESALRLGEIYMNEESVKDYQSAIYWLNLAIQGGNKDAYNDLAIIYGSEACYDEEKLAYINQMNKE